MVVFMFRKLLIGLLLVTNFAAAATFAPGATYQVCFTPGGGCTKKIVNVIAGAKHDVDMQAYGFTSKKIAYALRKAVRRGVKVTAIYDAENFDPMRFSYAKILTRAGAECKVDSTVSIAHNKVIIVDGKTLITGSFNFTYAAQHKNAENVLIIKDKKLVADYLANFWRRYRVSERCLF